MKVYLSNFFLLLTLSSCGPSAAEVAAREKVITDSVASAIRQQLMSPEDKSALQKARADSIAAAIEAETEIEKVKQDSIVAVEKAKQDSIWAVEQENLKMELIELKTRIKEVQKQLRNY